MLFVAVVIPEACRVFDRVLMKIRWAVILSPIFFHPWPPITLTIITTPLTPLCMLLLLSSTSGRLHSAFVRLLFLSSSGNWPLLCSFRSSACVTWPWPVPLPPRGFRWKGRPDPVSHNNVAQNKICTLDSMQMERGPEKLFRLNSLRRKKYLRRKFLLKYRLHCPEHLDTPA
jgi:hypothetical protein